ncbi:Lsr2 family protein [Corynebacterium sp.]|uniref:histone-like nucleoid-structuring protein Lsr2 n=1 Tax=Corynebacterium sp. TaxID=1720 RepID=UPI0026E0BC21|nr:Lsr2 family protein [Corynebacterium sp.]MDO5512319.1 Lsr2 family protein [Corynebacterium sp.]
MSRREITQFFDDLDNSPLKDTEVNVIRFSVDGEHYVIDLSEDNAEAFRAALEPWIAAAQPAPAQQKSGGGRQSGPSAAAKRERSRAIREWARANKLDVSERGKIPASVIEAYDKANPSGS